MRTRPFVTGLPPMGLCLAVALFSASAGADTGPGGATAAAALPAGAATSAPALDAQSIDVLSVSLSAEGFLIDLRYRAKGIEQAQAILNQDVHPTLINETTGERYTVPRAPKVGTLRQTTRGKQQALHPGATYFMLFANARRRLQAGDKVTLDAGDLVVKHLVVR